MRKVQSSNIAGFDFDASESNPTYGTLTIEFRNGRTYTYDAIPLEVSETLDRLADEGGSVGSYFSKHVRPFYQGVEVIED